MLLVNIYNYLIGNNYISKNEYESFADMIDDVGDR